MGNSEIEVEEYSQMQSLQLAIGETQKNAIELQTETSSVDVIRNVPEKEFEPEIGMEFEDECEAYNFYNDYAREIGFSIRKQHMARNSSGLIVVRRFVCYKDGFRKPRSIEKHVKYNRPNERTGCQAHIGIKRTKTGKFCIHRLELKHNHPLVLPSQRHLLRSQRKIDVARMFVADIASAVGIKQKPTFDLLSSTVGGRSGLSFTNADFKNYLYKVRETEMKIGDAGAVARYLQKKAADDRNFYSALQLDLQDNITNIFWTDGKSQIDYEYFGDVVCFDTTYKTNGYGRPFAPFVGVNHHKQTVIFGAALLYDESTETFKWLFETFKEAMNGKAPLVILTDECAAMSKAIEEIWPNTRHRLCVWHIYQNAAKHLSHIFQASSSFKRDFSYCVYECEFEDEFASAWQAMLEKYNLKTNAWLAKLFELRRKWALVYGRQTFCADMKSTQRSERMNGVIKQYLNPDQDLMSFFRHYDRLVEDRRYNELEADFRASQSTPSVPLSKLLRQAATVYTPKVYEMFAKEFELFVDSVLEIYGEVENKHVYKVNNLETRRMSCVTYDITNDSISCSCKKFEFVGILCSHALKVLDYKNIKEISKKYILNRWRKDVKHGIKMNYYDSSCEISPKEAIANRYFSLSRVYGQIMEKGSKSEAAYNIAIMEAQNLVKRLDDALTITNMHQPQPSNNEAQDFVVNCLPQDPIGETNGSQAKEDRRIIIQRAKGFKKKEKERGRCRIKSSLEKNQSKHAKGKSANSTSQPKLAKSVRIGQLMEARNNTNNTLPFIQYPPMKFPESNLVAEYGLESSSQPYYWMQVEPLPCIYKDGYDVMNLNQESFVSKACSTNNLSQWGDST